ncbi:MAG TPA: hypothetical protein ENK18_19940 [Deltaproteobacteria bacterium]|nr:hypothetical protein [Deltaproteobacteria bacterium]
MAAWVRVFASVISYEAQIVRAALEAAGIEARVQGADRVPGAFGADAQTEVYVSRHAEADAHELLGTALRRDRAGALSLAPEAGGALSLAPGGVEPPPGPERCPGCAAPWEPGFEVCWSCGQRIAP